MCRRPRPPLPRSWFFCFGLSSVGVRFFYQYRKPSIFCWTFSVFLIYFVLYAPIAQSVEQVPFKDKVAGSIPAGRTKFQRNFVAPEQSKALC